MKEPISRLSLKQILKSELIMDFSERERLTKSHKKIRDFAKDEHKGDQER